MTLTSSQVRKVLARLGVVAAVAVLAIRGADGSDNIGVYDDDVIGITPTGIQTYQGNTNPSRRRDGVAELVPGVWSMVPGVHGITTGRPRPAFRQAPDASFTVRRHNRSGLFRGYFAINLHDGGWNSTSSLGCITLPPDEFKRLVGQLYPALGWTAAKSKADPMGDRAPRFPVIVQTRDQVEAILAEEELEAIAPGRTGVRPLDISLPGGVAFSGGLLVADQSMVPIRAFVAALLKVKPEEAPIIVRGDGSDPDKLDDVLVNGSLLTEVAEELQPATGKPSRLWGWAPEIAAALGRGVEWKDGKLTVLAPAKVEP
jgi:hypothetical protein